MRKFSSDLLKIIENTEVPFEHRQCMISYLLAKKVAYCLPLPTGQVDSHRLYFAEHCNGLAKEKVSLFNENLVVDVPNTVELVKQIWTLRYRAVHDPFNISNITFFNALIQSGKVSEVSQVYAESLQAVGDESVAKIGYFLNKGFEGGL